MRRENFVYQLKFEKFEKINNFILYDTNTVIMNSGIRLLNKYLNWLEIPKLHFSVFLCQLRHSVFTVSAKKKRVFINEMSRPGWIRLFAWEFFGQSFRGRWNAYFSQHIKTRVSRGKHGYQILTCCENFKMSFAKIQGSLRRLKTCSKAPTR